MLGLYVHIPFCTSICNYCNFNRGLYDAVAEDPIRGGAAPGNRAQLPARQPADTLFFGGGTPSLLDPRRCRGHHSRLPRRASSRAFAEVTLETNPETVDQAKLDAFRAAGVNRLSFGVQSFDDRELVRLGRIHTAARAAGAMRAARSAGFANVSLDLMMWLPGHR